MLFVFSTGAKGHALGKGSFLLLGSLVWIAFWLPFVLIFPLLTVHLPMVFAEGWILMLMDHSSSIIK